MNRKTALVTSVYMLFTVIVISINHTLHLQFINLINYKVAIINLIITWIYLILSVYINFISRELAIKEQQYNQQQDYIHTIDGLINDFRRLKHNHANTIYSIYGYIQEEDWNGLKAYFDEVMDETRRISSNTLLALQKIKLYAVFGLLWAKVNEAEAMAFNLEVEVSSEIRDINIKMRDLCEVLGNYLDNAIEAAGQSTAKKLKVSIVDDTAYTYIAIQNSFGGELDIKKLYEKGYSSKGEGRGYELYLTEEILSKYQNVLHNTSVEEGMFKQELSIKK
jgi:two-component system sensor histidine kinase AgrC